MPCNGTSACGEYVVQPEMGKLLIAGSEWLFGLNSFGWRFASALFGSLAILLMCRIARRMTRFTLLGCIAGLLIVPGRPGVRAVADRGSWTSTFLMFFVLAAFGCVLILDADISRAALAGKPRAPREGGPAGPRLGHPPVAGGGRDLPRPGRGDQVGRGLVHHRAGGAGHRVGYRGPPGGRAPASFVRGGLREMRPGCRSRSWLIPLAVYLASWSGWFATSTPATTATTPPSCTACTPR